MKIRIFKGCWEDISIEDILKNDFLDINLFDIEDDVDNIIRDNLSGTNEEIEKVRKDLIERSYRLRQEEIDAELSIFSNRKKILNWIKSVLEYSDIYILSEERILEEILKNSNK